mmetsp:Transcript_26805/g.53498  ORF Transcript_26805/g.53498 Transcript_26805/m.53498 type:complete len:207 (+) Transcript_26805:526-1146(+)
MHTLQVNGQFWNMNDLFFRHSPFFAQSSQFSSWSSQSSITSSSGGRISKSAYSMKSSTLSSSPTSAGLFISIISTFGDISVSIPRFSSTPPSAACDAARSSSRESGGASSFDGNTLQSPLASHSMDSTTSSSAEAMGTSVVTVPGGVSTTSSSAEAAGNATISDKISTTLEITETRIFSKIYLCCCVTLMSARFFKYCYVIVDRRS